MRHLDHIIIGQGLAGSTLAWALLSRGFRVCVIDRGDPVSASRIAAGLITPVTGLRMAASWRFAELFAFASHFYQRLENTQGEKFFHVNRMIRLFIDEPERVWFEKRADTLLKGLVEAKSDIDHAWFAAEHGGFEMPVAARLETTRYLDSLRRIFLANDMLIRGELDIANDIVLDRNTVRLPRFDVEATRILFCQGYEGHSNALFPGTPFNPAKGEILELNVPGLDERRVVHRGIWLAPAGGDRFLAGSTYEREQLDNVPTQKGRDEILSRLRQLLRLPFDVVTHRAAVRPVMRDGRPVIGLHPTMPQFGYFNGLGSKGSLLAPYFASQFAATLAGQGEIEPEVSLKRLRI